MGGDERGTGTSERPEVVACFVERRDGSEMSRRGKVAKRSESEGTGKGKGPDAQRRGDPEPKAKQGQGLNGTSQ